VNDSIDTDVTQIGDPQVMRAKARVGQVLNGKWRLDVLLGVGGMASVYAVTHRNGSRAAVKLLHPELSTNSAVRGRFLREGYVANAVGHDGAVKVIDDDKAEDESLFLVTELLDGETLEDRRIRYGGRLGQAEVLWLTDKILDVLIAAHAKGIIHRDIKPDNVFVTRAGQVKVIDFGIARLRETQMPRSATKSGAAMGTPAFMPPEQALGLWDEVGARSDLWALGATMVNLLTGRLLHEARTAEEQMLFSMTKNSPSLQSMLPGAHRDICRLVDRALAFDKSLRWPDAKSMQGAVRAAYFALCGKPIADAPPLLVPSSVPNRTLPGSTTPTPTPSFPTTARPVESASRNVTTVAKPPARAVPMAAMIASAMALGVALTTAAWLLSTADHHDEPAIASAPVATALPPPTTAAPTIPVVSLESLPMASAPTTTPEPPSKVAPAPLASAVARPHASGAPSTSAATAASARPDCNPPYTLNPVSGMKHFKLECL